MSRPLPPDDAATTVRPGGPVPPAGPGDMPPGPEPGPSRRLGWGMLLGALVLLLAAGAGVAAYLATRDDGSNAATTSSSTRTSTAVVAPGRVFVPDVTGLKQEAAAARLGRARLVPVARYRPTAKPTGVVVAQEPNAGQRAKRGTKVTIVVDQGAPAVVVPDVTTLAVGDAGAQITKAGLEPRATNVTVSDPARAGTVVAQVPAAGTRAKKGTVVTLSVARAPGTTATTTTTTATATTTATTSTTAATTTTRTTTTQTTTTAPQPTTATVPDLTGTDLAQASHALSNANLLASVQYVPSGDPLGSVVAQSPSAGNTAQARAHVGVNVSSGPGQKVQQTVPDVVGQSLDQAVQTLNSSQLRLIFVKVPVTTRAQVGKVVEQTPLAGKTAPTNAQVLVYLGVLRQ